MGSHLSKTQGYIRKKTIGDGPSTAPTVEGGKEGEKQVVEGHRLQKLLKALGTIIKLQEEIVNDQIDRRQKTREASNMRRKVWICDDNFMKLVQKLGAEGRFREFDDLTALAAKCQAARDALGSVEQEGIVAERKWEGQLWDLQVAEKSLVEEFQFEFQIASTYEASDDSYSNPDSEEFVGNQLSSDHSLNNHFGMAIRPMGGSIASQPSLVFGLSPTSIDEQTTSIDRNTELLGLVETSNAASGNLSNVLYPNSITEDIDILLETYIKNNPSSVSKQISTMNLELYPQLVEDFRTKRNRINSWLLEMALGSRFESISIYKILKEQLSKEDLSCPSNWAQLVIEYWTDVLPISDLPQASKTDSG